MRIALDLTYSVDPHPSGIAIYSRELFSGLARHYPRDEFLGCYRLKQFRQAPQNPAHNVHRRLLLPPVPTFRADVFHALNQRVDRRPAKVVISTFHDLFVLTGDYSTPEFRARFIRQARLAASNSDLIIAVSEFTASQVSELLGFDHSRIRVVPHGVHPPAALRPARRRNIILFVGALQIRKNIVRLVEAFECLPRDWVLVLAGSASGYGAPGILERIGRSPARNRIEITGYVAGAHLEQLYMSASIFAFPSLDEGFGIPVLEAMAYGVPVVTSNRSALVEIAQNAAILVDPEETEGLAAALCKLIHDAGLRSELISRGLSRASSFTWERTIRSTHKIYEETK